MSTLTIKVSRGEDDGLRYYGGFDSSGVGVSVGNYGGLYNTYYKFDNVTIPPGSIINSCILTLTANYSTTATTVNTNLYFDNEDNATSPTSTSTYDGKSVTNAVSWNAIGSWTKDTTTNAISPEMKDILQTIINRSGWTSGNSIMVMHKNNGSTNGTTRRAYAYEGSTTKCAQLDIDYTPPSASTGFQTTNKGIW